MMAALGLSGCAYEIGYHEEYLPQEPPAYVAQGKLLIVMPDEQQRFIYEGPPSSRVGQHTTLVVPIGSLVEQVARHVFGDCFAYGVEVAESREGHHDYVLAIEGDMQQFVYGYTKAIDAGFSARADAWVVPEVNVAFAVRGYNPAGEIVLDKVYDSGVTAGDEEYSYTSDPGERINRVLHSTLHELMVELVADVRPLLMEECEITERAIAWP